MQHLGLIAVLILIVGLASTILKRPAGLDVTFSQRVANSKWAEILYSLLFITALPILFLFFAAWFVPTNNMPQSFLWFAGIAIVFQIACTWVPERGGKRTAIHRVLTGVSGIALIPLMVILATTQSFSTSLRYAIWVALTLMIVLLVIALANQKGFRYALLLQVGYYALFFGTILLTTYA